MSPPKPSPVRTLDVLKTPWQPSPAESQPTADRACLASTGKILRRLCLGGDAQGSVEGRQGVTSKDGKVDLGRLRLSVMLRADTPAARR